MLMKHALGACISALLVSACGGAPTEEAGPSSDSLESHEQALLFACDGTRSFTRYWYSDANMTLEVGRDDCDCGPSYVEHGERGAFYDQRAVYTCDGGGPGGGGGGDPGDGCLNPSLKNPPPGC